MKKTGSIFSRRSNIKRKLKFVHENYYFFFLQTKIVLFTMLEPIYEYITVTRFLVSFGVDSISELILILSSNYYLRRNIRLGNLQHSSLH